MRRRFFLFAAPAIVAAPSLMKVSAAVLPTLDVWRPIRPGVFTAEEIAAINNSALEYYMKRFDAFARFDRCVYFTERRRLIVKPRPQLV